MYTIKNSRKLLAYVWLSVYKRPFYQIVESNRIESNFFPESECSTCNLRFPAVCSAPKR